MHPSGNASEKSSVNTFAQGDSFPQSGGPVLEKSVASHPLDLLQVSTHITQTFSSLYTTSQATESSSGQSVQSQPLDLLQSSAHNTLMSAPLSSLSQSGHSMSSQSAMSQAHELLSAPLSSFSQPHQSSVSQPLDLLPASPQNTLLSAPLSSLTQLGGLSCAQARKTGFLDLVQASSQNTLLSTPLSSLSGGSLSCQSVTSQSLDPLEASPQKSLMSAPLSSFSQSGESLSGLPRTSQSLGFSQSSSQSTKLSASSSSMVSSGGSLFSDLQPMDLLQMSPQNTLLSTSLSSLTKSEGTLSDSPVTSPSLDVLQPFHNPLLSASLSSLSAHPTTRPQESSISLPLGSLSQLSFQQGNSVTGIPHSTSKSPLLQTMSSHTLLSTPLSRLSQTPFATAIYEPRQESSLSTPLSSLSQTGHSVQSSLPLTSSGQLGNTEPLPMEQVVDDTEDVKYLAENLKNVHIPGSSSTLSAGKEDYDQNIQHKHKHSTSGTASTVELSVDQKEMKSEHFSVKKKVSASKQKRQVSSRWSDTHRLTAKPSLFGLALCYSLSVENASTKVVVQRVVNELHNSDCLRITAFDFSTPSPDDIVKDKQKGAFSRKK